MSNAGEFKIRTLPRKDEGRRSAPSRARASAKFPPWALPVLVGIGVLVATALLAPSFKPKPVAVAHEQSSHGTYQDPIAGKLDNYARDAKFKEHLLRQRSQIENAETRPTEQIDPTVTGPEANRTYGVNMDSENTADQLYETLNDRPTLNTDSLPETRINARLEKNKWLNQLDRQERVQFVRNFIKSAYDRGYEVELDQNLVVTGVKPIRNRTISLDQVIDRVSKENQ